MAFRWLSKLRRSRRAPGPVEQSGRVTRPAPAPPPPPRSTATSSAPPPPPRRVSKDEGVVDEPRVGLILEDGTSVLPPNDPEWEEKMRYYARGVIPGVGSSDDPDREDR